MKTLVIYAHPKTEGFCSTILESVKNKLEENNSPYEVLDLYDMNYDPILHENEHYTSRGDHKNISEENLKIQEKIKESNKIIFIFPIWWNSVPAILKGFFDKVFTSPFAFEFSPKGIPIGNLKGKEGIIFTASGSAKWQNILFLGDRAIKTVKNDTLGFCGIKAKAYHVYNANRLNEDKKNEIRNIIKKAL